MNSPAIVLTDVEKSYGSKRALHPTSFTIERGESVALLGPNGAGKTTTISLMVGLRRPTAGTVRLLGRAPGDQAARVLCGAMLQESGVPPVLRVRELVDTFRAYYPDPLPRSVIIETAGLEDYVDAKVSALSGGYRQRLYFALAIAGNPTVLFLDEPTSRMDTATRIGFLQRIREFADSGRTVILTTHYLDEADALADRVIVVDQGSVIADASPSAIKGRLGGKRVRFETRLGIELHELSSLPYHTVSFDGALATFITDDPEDLLRGLFERGIPVSSLEVSGADLEEAFLALTNQRPDRGQAFRVEIARGAA